MKIVAIVGPSQSGKTRLISGLICEFKKRDLNVAAIKHCDHGFDFDVEGKDSWKFKEAGADAVALMSPAETAVIQKNSEPQDIRALVEKYFDRADIVLVEGGKQIKGLKKIEVVRRGISGRIEILPEELLAIFSDSPLTSDRPVFGDSKISDLADFLISNLSDESQRVGLRIDGREIDLNPFVQSFLEKTTLGMIGSLRDVPLDPEHLTLTLTRRERKNEKP